MSKALSVDLRDRVVAAIEGGMSCQAALRFGVSAASAIRWRMRLMVTFFLTLFAAAGSSGKILLTANALREREGARGGAASGRRRGSRAGRELELNSAVVVASLTRPGVRRGRGATEKTHATHKDAFRRRSFERTDSRGRLGGPSWGSASQQELGIQPPWSWRHR